MKKEFAPYELALRMKQLGFDEPCLGYFTSPKELIIQQPKDKNGVYVYFAPTYSQAFRWFREKYDLYPSINIYNDKWLCVIKSTISNETEISGYIVATINNGHPTFETYEEAELKCLEKLIEIVESK